VPAGKSSPGFPGTVTRPDFGRVLKLTMAAFRHHQMPAIISVSDKVNVPTRKPNGTTNSKPPIKTTNQWRRAGAGHKRAGDVALAQLERESLRKFNGFTAAA
jgi:hypothetical protein